MTTRLFFLIAREAPVAVVFRRGPSKHVLLVRWDLSDDSFEAGQWLTGRVYERRCDLSPDGEHLIYFAANYAEHHPLQTWTAVSRPPYFTALALWQKGNAWGGGGLFPNRNEILLNHPADNLDPADESQIPRDWKVSMFANAGREEDEPIFRERMSRDGWVLIDAGRWVEQDGRSGLWWTADPPETWAKSHPHGQVGGTLRMKIHGVKERQGPWYVQSYQLVNRAARVVREFGRADWADWDSSGDLLLASDGKLVRIRVRADNASVPARELVDLSDLRFNARPPVPEATAWTGVRPHGVRIEAAQQARSADGA